MTIAKELKAASRLRTAQFLITHRPWLVIVEGVPCSNTLTWRRALSTPMGALSTDIMLPPTQVCYRSRTVDPDRHTIVNDECIMATTM
ncbi:hypothetical protein AKJ16_DCAP22404 [Drosera capensis]